MPQKIRKGLGQEKVHLYLRVNRSLPKADIVLKRNGEELKRFRKVHLAPGEMQSLVFEGDLLEKAGSGDEIEVALEEI